MAAKYELPEEVSEERLKSLGREVEMKTFQTNVDPEAKTKDSSHKSLKQTSRQRDNGTTVVPPLVKLFCVGDYTGGRDKKGVFVKDYL